MRKTEGKNIYKLTGISIHVVSFLKKEIGNNNNTALVLCEFDKTI